MTTPACAGASLGSANVMLNSSGAKIGEMRYKPFGATRYTWGSTPTDRRFTGQQEESALGSLYEFNARYYSPALGRFLSADTIVPGAGNPQAFNRYAYSLSNPLKYTDPSGFYSEDQIKQFFGLKSDAPWEEVLKFFEKGGALEGRWGWLEILRQADNGSGIRISDIDLSQLPEGHPLFGDGDIQGVFQVYNDKLFIKMLTKLGDMLLPQELGAKHGNRYELENRGCNLMQTACAVTSRFETSAFDKYSHTRIKLEKFVEDPLATIDLIKMGGITLFTGGLTVGMVTAVESACLNPIACAGAHAVMAPNIAAAGTATFLLLRATSEYFVHEFTESTP